MALTKSLLAQNNIFLYTENQRQLPPNVVNLGRDLLDFRGTISQKLGYEREDHYENCGPCTALGFQCYDCKEVYKSYTTKKGKARALAKGKDREREWANFYSKHFFEPMADQTDIRDEDSRRVSRSKFYFDYFEYAEGRLWSFFSKEYRDEHGQVGLSQPRPDRVAYFPVLDPATIAARKVSGSTASTKWNWEDAPIDSMIENFSARTLQRLAAHGLHFNVANPLSKGHRKGSRSVASDWISYPWLIVEHKKAEHQDDAECYCQAANSGAAALMVARTLVQHAAYKLVLPVVVVTTVGATVRVWICFYDDKSRKYEMVCFWKGVMTSIVDIVKFKTILENAYTWATRVLRPWISLHIDEWAFACTRDTVVVPGDDEEAIVSIESQEEALRYEALCSTKSNPIAEARKVTTSLLAESYCYATVLREQHRELLGLITSLKAANTKQELSKPASVPSNTPSQLLSGSQFPISNSSIKLDILRAAALGKQNTNINSIFRQSSSPIGATSQTPPSVFLPTQKCSSPVFSATATTPDTSPQADTVRDMRKERILVCSERYPTGIRVKLPNVPPSHYGPIYQFQNGASSESTMALARPVASLTHFGFCFQQKHPPHIFNKKFAHEIEACYTDDGECQACDISEKAQPYSDGGSSDIITKMTTETEEFSNIRKRIKAKGIFIK
ncbi:hypothetical protein BX600DRAFT_439019 [Xylariales sp. PMI_506]|nr:hypothetical protein BX600DRAFT_439019 [Xylariales sp. PMI_506]